MKISVSELLDLGENGATIMNVGRHAGSTEIRGAIRYRPDDLLIASHLALPIATDRPVILYDEHGNNSALEEIAAKLERDGHPNVRILDGGFAAYKAVDGPTQEASTEQVVPPTRSSEAQALDRRL